MCSMILVGPWESVLHIRNLFSSLAIIAELTFLKFSCSMFLPVYQNIKLGVFIHICIMNCPLPF